MTPITPLSLESNGIKDNKKINGFAAFPQEFERSTSIALKEILYDQCPIDVLPPWLQDLFTQLHTRNRFPIEYSLVYVLFVASVAIGNNFRAEVKKNWHEPALLFLCVVALAGQTKTPVQNFFTAVLRKINQRLFDEFKIKLEAHRLAKKAASKDFPFTEPEPAREQILIQDSTLEATIKVLSNNLRGAGILYDELAGFFGGLNKYNSGNDLPFYLSAYNCQAYTSNRKTSDDVYLSHPYLSIAGGIQPAILTKTFSDEMQDNGTKDRFLFVYPQNIKKEIPTDEEIEPELIDKYASAIEYLMQAGDNALRSLQGFEKEKYITIPFATDARAALFEYLQINADQVNEYNDDHEYRLASAFSKFDYHVIRLSFILQFLNDAGNRELPTQISLDSVQKGIRLANYFKWHTKRVHSLISGDPIASYDEKKKAFYNALPNYFTTGEAVEIAMSIRKEDLNALVKPDAIEKWAKRFVDCPLFIKPSHGNYQKK